MNSESTSPFDALARSNLNSAWGALAVDVLARLGVQTIVTSPGSRSTPLTVAAVRNPKVEALTILDERSASFFALGLAKSSRRPVGLVCTSGSALANYMPAVVESSMSGVPLILMTADRPPELQDCNSGQTIDQLKIYGDFTRFFHSLALPELTLMRYLRQTLVHAVFRSLQPAPGPVHLNFPFRDPLTPEPEQDAVCSTEYLEQAATVVARSCEAERPPGSFDSVVVERMASHRRGLIVVGAECPPEGDKAFSAAVIELAQKLGWPIIADALNPLRNQLSSEGVLITSYDAFLRQSRTADRLEPSCVLQIGSLPTSKVLRAWLARIDPVSFLLTRLGDNNDPLHRTAIPLYGGAQELNRSVPDREGDSTWLEVWEEAEQVTRKVIDGKLDEETSLFEGKVAWLISQHVPEGSKVFLANSMSVRYAEYFWKPNRRSLENFCNRGANGIDGTLSTAMGVAHGGASAILLTGDLAFLHDSNAFLARAQMRGSLTVVVINNSGSGIFEHLPIAECKEVFETYFATPQTVDIGKLCLAHGIPHRIVKSWPGFIELIRARLGAGIRVIEVPTDRKADVAQLRTLLQRIAEGDGQHS